jgi:hypothetical protein
LKRLAALMAAALGLTMAGCTLDGGGLAGKTCQSASDCPQDLVCVQARPGQGRTCEALALPPQADIQPPIDVPAQYFCADIGPLLTQYCGACHGADRSGSGNLPFRLDVYADAQDGSLKGAHSMSDRILARLIQIGDMPPASSPQPTADDKAKIQAWIQADAPECQADAGI